MYKYVINSELKNKIENVKAINANASQEDVKNMSFEDLLVYVSALKANCPERLDEEGANLITQMYSAYAKQANLHKANICTVSVLVKEQEGVKANVLHQQSIVNKLNKMVKSEFNSSKYEYYNEIKGSPIFCNVNQKGAYLPHLVGFASCDTIFVNKDALHLFDVETLVRCFNVCQQDINMAFDKNYKEDYNHYIREANNQLTIEEQINEGYFVM